MRVRYLLAGLAAAALIPAVAAAQDAYYDAPPGHYDINGVWVAGPAAGYYDSDGVWVSTAPAPSASDSGADVAYYGPDLWAGAPLETRAREDWLERRIDRYRDEGRIDAADAQAMLDELIAIRRTDWSYRSYTGELSSGQEARILGRLDALRHDVHAMARE